MGKRGNWPWVRDVAWTALGVMALSASVQAYVRGDAEFALAGKVPEAQAAVPMPDERTFEAVSFDVAAAVRDLRGRVAAAQAMPLKRRIRDERAVRAALALDALETAGTNRIAALVASAPKYAAFARWFLGDVEAMRLYAGAGLVAKDSSVGWRVFADIWARAGGQADFPRYLSLAAGLAACWGAGPCAERLQYQETLPPGDHRSDPVWRYFFFRQSHREGRLYRGFGKLRPWEIRFVAGNPWDDESLLWLQRRINVPPDQYGWACWSAKYAGTSAFGGSVQGPLFYIQAPASMGEGERTVTMGGVCGGLSHVGAHAAAAHGIPAYCVGQPGHCAYAFRRRRGAWEGGFGGPDGWPHNWIYPGTAPMMTRLMEAAFADDAEVDRAVVLRAFARAGGSDAAEALARLCPYDWYVQRAHLDTLQGAALANHVSALTRTLKGYGFAAFEMVKPRLADVRAAMGEARFAGWTLDLHRAIAQTPPSWAFRGLPEILKVQTEGLDDVRASALLARLFRIYVGAVNDQAFGQLLEWSIGTYVAQGRERVFTEAFRSIAEGRAPGQALGVGKSTFEKAILAAEKAGSVPAVEALSDLAAQQGFSDGYDRRRAPVAMPEGMRLLTEGALLEASSTSGWDRPVDHRNVMRHAPGAFHTNYEPAPWVKVRLAQKERVAAFTLVKNSGNEWRSRRLRVSRSVDGQTFFPVAETNDAPNEWTVVLDAPQEARWIRVEQLNDRSEVFHLRNILVYGKEVGR